MHNKIRSLSTLALIALITLTSACSGMTRTGEVRSESETIELQGAEEADVHLRMGAGQLTVTGGTDALAEADFTYNVAAWQPTLDYVVSGGQGKGELWIEQPEVKNLTLDSYRYEWDVTLNDEIPLTLDIGLGAGESKIDVSTLALTQLDLEIGAGGVEVDLTGERTRDVDVSIRGGVGEAMVLLPANVGVKATASGGIGEVTVSGLTQEGDTYVNDAYSESEATITLDIEGGIGGITLKVVE